MSGPLQDFAQNPVVMQLGWTILHFLWQATIVAASMAIILRCLRNANSRYLAACMALMVLAILPVVTWIRLANTDPINQLARFQPVTRLTESNVGFPNIKEPKAEFLPADRVSELNQGYRTPRSSERWDSGCQVVRWLEPALPFVAVVWMIGVLVMGFRLIAGCIEVGHIRHAATVLPESSWQIRFAKLAKRFNIRRTARLLQSNQVQGMVQIGWLRPVVLVPVSMLTDLTPQELDALLMHELAHIRRNDYLVNLVQCVVETFLFFHPVIWWVSHVIRTEREHCCDDLAVQICGHPKIYVDALTAANQLQLDAIPLGLSASGVQLMSRIERICQLYSARHRIHKHNLSLDIFFVILPLLAFASMPIWFPGVRYSHLGDQHSLNKKIQSLQLNLVKLGPEPIRLTDLPASEHSLDLHSVTLKQNGQLLISSRIHRNEDHQGFVINLTATGEVVIQVIPLTEGFRPYLRTWWPSFLERNGSDGDIGSGRGGRPIQFIDHKCPDPPDNWIIVKVSGNHDRPDGDWLIGDYADYLVHIHQKPSRQHDWDPDTLGIESSPIVLNSSGYARAHPGKIRGRMPGIDSIFDVDTFQIRTISNHPLKLTVDGTVGELDPYVRVYNSNFQLIDEAPKNKPQRSVTLTIPNTNPGQLYYLAVSSYASKTEGIYMVQIRQQPEDSPKQY